MIMLNTNDSPDVKLMNTNISKHNYGTVPIYSTPPIKAPPPHFSILPHQPNHTSNDNDTDEYREAIWLNRQVFVGIYQIFE